MNQNETEKKVAKVTTHRVKKRKFAESVELMAEETIKKILTDPHSERKLKFEAAKFVIEQNRGRAGVQSVDGAIKGNSLEAFITKFSEGQKSRQFVVSTEQTDEGIKNEIKMSETLKSLNQGRKFKDADQ